MSRSTLSFSIGFLVCLVTASAYADQDAPPAHTEPHIEHHGADSVVFADFEYLQRGKLHFDFGAIDYRLAREGLNLSTRVGGAATRALIGLDGDRRIEIGWQLRGANVTLAVAEQDDRSEYRVELARKF